MARQPVRKLSSRKTPALESLESRVMFVRVEGVDVSLFQGVIDWPALAATGKQFVFMRASRTNLTKDNTFDRNEAGARAAGLLVGPYHFTYPNSINEAGPVVDPVLDARKFFAAAGRTMTTGYLRPVIDSEAGSSLGKEQMSQWILNFSDEIYRLSGVRPIVYANINYAVNFLDERVAAVHDLWLARYNAGNDPTQVDPQTSQPDLASFHPNPYGSWNVPYGGPRSDSSWAFWQYTSMSIGSQFGVSSTYLDQDLFNGSLDELKERFMIGYQKNYPEGAAPFAVGPGVTTTIEAENYDIGGEGVSYSDSTSAENVGAVFRTSVREGVDLAAIDANANQYRIADAEPGEFVEYTFNVSQADDYTLSFALSQIDPDATFHAEIDGIAQPTLAVPQTNDVNRWSNVDQSVALTPGEHVLRVAFDTAAANGIVASLDKIEISQTPEPGTPPPPPPPGPTPEGLTGNAASVRSGLFAAQNFANASELYVQRGRGAANNQIAYLSFDLSGTTSISTGKLRLYGRLSDDAVPSITANVYSVSNTRASFQEELVTYKKKPGAKKLRGSLNINGTSNSTYEVDLTAFLQSELAAGQTRVTLAIRGVTKADTQAIFASDDAGGANVPQLILT